MRLHGTLTAAQRRKSVSNAAFACEPPPWPAESTPSGTGRRSRPENRAARQAQRFVRHLASHQRAASMKPTAPAASTRTLVPSSSSMIRHANRHRFGAMSTRLSARPLVEGCDRFGACDSSSRTHAESPRRQSRISSVLASVLAELVDKDGLRSSRDLRSVENVGSESCRGLGDVHFSEISLRIVDATRRGLRPAGLHGADSGRGARTAGPGERQRGSGRLSSRNGCLRVHGIECRGSGIALPECVRESRHGPLHETSTAAQRRKGVSNDGVCLRAATIGRLMST